MLDSLKISDFSSSFSTQFATKSTTDLAEGVKLFFTDERAQDAVGGMLLDTGDIDLSYDDAAPSLSASLLSTAITGKTQVTADGSDSILVSDASDSGNLKKVLLSSVVSLGGGGFTDTWTSGTSFTSTHNLNSLDVIVQLYDVNTGETIYADSVVRNSVNQIQLSATEAPTGSGWRVLIRKV